MQTESLDIDQVTPAWDFTVPKGPREPLTYLAVLILIPLMFGLPFGKFIDAVLGGISLQKALVPIAITGAILFGSERFRVHPSSLIVAALAIWCSISLLLSSTFIPIWISLIGYFALANIVCNGLCSFRELDLMLKAYLVGIALVAVAAAFALMQIYDVGVLFGNPMAPLQWYGLPSLEGTEANTTSFSTYFAIALPLAAREFMLARKVMWKFGLAFLIVLFTVELMLTFGRSSMFGAILGSALTVYFASEARLRLRVLMIGVPGILFSIMVVAAVSFELFSGAELDAIQKGLNAVEKIKDYSSNVHGSVLRAAIELVITSPPWGVGYGNVEAAIGRLSGFELNTHNMFLGVAAEYGIPALALFLWFIIQCVTSVTLALRSETDRRRRSGYGVVLAIVSALLLDGMFHENYINSQFWTFLSIALACHSLAWKDRMVLSIVRLKPLSLGDPQLMKNTVKAT